MPEKNLEDISQLFPDGMVQTCRWQDCCSLLAGTGLITVVSPASLDELQQCLNICRRDSLDIIPLGGGTNLVGLDDDRRLIAIRLGKSGEFGQISPLPDGSFSCGAAWNLSRLISHLANQGRGGMSALSGIPGTLGGALAMNAGANGHEISEFVRKITGITWHDGKKWEWTAGQGGWGYRTSPVPPQVIVLAAELSLIPVDPSAEQQLLLAEKQRRARVTPAGASAGSVFRNPDGNRGSAGALLEQSGCKGMTSGNYSVSLQHANWIVNLRRQPGPAEDCRLLVENMRQQVRQSTGLDLHCEWRWAEKYCTAAESAPNE